jgi:hypothetical protein
VVTTRLEHPKFNRAFIKENHLDFMWNSTALHPKNTPKPDDAKTPTPTYPIYKGNHHRFKWKCQNDTPKQTHAQRGSQLIQILGVCFDGSK